METSFKFKVGDKVYDTRAEEIAVVEQKRIQNTHKCYRLSNGRIVHENFLKA